MVFDVGANVGNWSSMVLQVASGTRIHAFEIAPPTFAKLERQLASLPNVSLNNCGLSDRAGRVEIDFLPQNDGLTSLLKDVAVELHSHYTKEPWEAEVQTGDVYCDHHSIGHIDFLKIDVEGAKSLVLRGFESMLRKRDIDVIQFEYGLASVYAHYLLIDYYRDLTDHGYCLGKLRPNGVEFRDYDPRHEDFIGPNFVAVNKDRSDLIRALTCKV